MKKEDKKKFAVIMKSLAEEFGGTISIENINIRFILLKAYSVEQISTAAQYLFKNRETTFPAIPTTKEIIEALNKISGKIDIKPKAEIECDKVLRNLNLFGRECPTVFKDKITNYLMSNRWSFYHLGMMSETDIKWWRKDFVEAYQEVYKNKEFMVQTLLNIDKMKISDIKKLVKIKNFNE